MNLTQSIDDLWTSLVASIHTVQVCFGDATGVADCNMVWKFSVVLACVAVLALSYSVLHTFMRRRAVVKQRKAEQAVASEDVMNQVRWQRKDTPVEAQSQQALTSQIKRALRQKKVSST